MTGGNEITECLLWMPGRKYGVQEDFGGTLKMYCLYVIVLISLICVD